MGVWAVSQGAFPFAGSAELRSAVTTSSTLPAGFRRNVCSKPRADLSLVHEQPPLIPGGNTVLRYVTKRGAIFEREESPNGPVHWFRVYPPKPEAARGETPSAEQYLTPNSADVEAVDE